MNCTAPDVTGCGLGRIGAMTGVARMGSHVDSARSREPRRLTGLALVLPSGSSAGYLKRRVGCGVSSARRELFVVGHQPVPEVPLRDGEQGGLIVPGEIPSLGSWVAENYEVVAEFDSLMPTGVTVTDEGRIFVSFPRWGDSVPYTVAEVVDGRPVAYPAPRSTSGTSLRSLIAWYRCRV